MPIYEFECKKCSKINEFNLKLSDPTPEKCPSCEAVGSLQKLISSTSFSLKGGGWYSDLYGSSKSSSNSDKADTKDSAPADANTSSPKKETTATPKKSESSASTKPSSND